MWYNGRTDGVYKHNGRKYKSKQAKAAVHKHNQQGNIKVNSPNKNTNITIRSGMNSAWRVVLQLSNHELFRHPQRLTIESTRIFIK